MNGQDSATNQERGEEPPVVIMRRSVEARMWERADLLWQNSSGSPA
jgi:hypothetical protein